jgi:hypothetical protein
LLALKEKGTIDITLDEPLLRYLSHAERPQDPRDERRVHRASQFIFMDDAGQLWFQEQGQVIQRQVPPIYMRARLIEVVFRQGGYPSGERLY